MQKRNHAGSAISSTQGTDLFGSNKRGGGSIRGLTGWVMAGLCTLSGALCAAPEKKAYAHYMGCWPAALRALPYAQKRAADELKKGADYTSLVGGNIVNWPLLPQGMELSAEANAELEIRRAMRAGFDGFAFDAWAGGEGAKEMFEAFIRTAEKMKVPFGLTVCFDPSCQPAGKPVWEAFVDTAQFVLRFKDSPNLARREGKPLFFGYHSIRIVPKSERNNIADDRTQWTVVGDTWKAFRQRVGTPVYLHGCLEIVAAGVEGDDAKAVALGKWAGGVFDAVGGFLGTEGGDWRFNKPLIAGVKASGAEWAQPLFSQYDNKAGHVIAGRGLDLLRGNWEAALSSGSTLLQFVTWNDYGEETSLAPAYGSNYTLSRVNRHYADGWKNGAEPQVTKDEIHLVFRKYRTEALTYPFGARNIEVPAALEVLTFLRKPGLVEVPGYGEFRAPAGMSHRQFELKPGKVSAVLRRGLFRRKKLSVEAPEAVSDKPWREDFTMVAYGSNDAEAWAQDFGSAPPLNYSEYGDCDGDGLPNWFEMVYFGQFPFMDTAGCAEARGDPDGDGFTNLQEYENRTDPLKPELPYAAGQRWSLNGIAGEKAFFNPHRDDRGNAVWHVFYKFGEARKIALDGRYNLCRNGGGAAQRKAYGSPAKDPEFGFGAGMAFQTNGTFTIGGRQGVVVAVGWKSPVDGAVDAVAQVKVGQGHGKVRVLLMKGAQELASAVLSANGAAELAFRSATVRTGDILYFIPDYRDSWGLGECTVERLEITLADAAE